MADLQLVIVVLGALIIAGVIAYNWVQERKLRQEVTNEFIVPQKDVLAEDFYIDTDAYVEKELAEHTEHAEKIKPRQYSIRPDPTTLEPALGIVEDSMLDDMVANTDYTSRATSSPEMQDEESPELLNKPKIEAAPATIFSSSAEMREELQQELVSPEPIVQAALHEKIQGIQASLPDAVHPQVDLSAILYATKNFSTADLSALSTSIGDIALPIMLHGLDSENKWYLLSQSAPSASFKQAACSLQLADRGGPVAKNLLNKFQFAVEDSGLALNAHVEWQGNGDAMQRAIELDQFCIEVDQLISVHLVQNETPIHGTKFKGLAEASGMHLKEDGKFYYYANGKEEPQFVLIDSNNMPFTAESLRTNVLKSVTFQIEIPKVNNCEQVFNQMIAMAQKMASSLSGRLVDDNQKPLGDLQIEKIRQQLKVIHATMVARGIMPGSASSMRLFS